MKSMMISFRNKPWLFTCILLTQLLVVGELFYYKNVDEKDSLNLIPDIPSPIEVVSNKAEFATLLAKYRNYEPQADDTTQSQSEEQRDMMSAEQQLQQKGLVKKLYIGEFNYQLVGLSKRWRSVIAVMLKRAGDGSSTQRITLGAGDMLDSYQVDSIDEKRITLSVDGRKVWLELFVPEGTSVAMK